MLVPGAVVEGSAAKMGNNASGENMCSRNARLGRLHKAVSSAAS